MSRQESGITNTAHSGGNVTPGSASIKQKFRERCEFIGGLHDERDVTRTTR